jgi:hypothetical protein
MSSAASMDALTAGALLRDIIGDPSDNTHKASALQALQSIKNDAATSEDGFDGYLVPPTTDTFIFVAEANSKPSLQLEGQSIEMKTVVLEGAEEEQSGTWSTGPVTLTGGQLYKIKLTGLPTAHFQWKTERSLPLPVPASSLLADHVTAALREIFAILYKCAIVINGLALTHDEVVHVSKNGADFGTDEAPFDWHAITLLTWQRMNDYTKLRNSLPKLDVRLVDLFIWAGGPEAKATEIAQMISRVTLWEDSDITALVSESIFGLLQPSDFKNEVNLIRLQKALEVSSKIGMPINSLFRWAKPQINFWRLLEIANGIRTAIRALYKLSDWEVAIKPTYDKLRQLQSDALTAYLINQPALRKQDVYDADSLFEFLLIDTQMCPCMETSRLKQATSTVQLFVQRCFLDLERAKYNIAPEALDRQRWKWMEKYRVWEANRKVFLYPENWIQPSLRDDKSPIYTQLESDLMQRDLTEPAMLEAMKNFLFRLEEVSNLEVVAVYVEDDITPGELTEDDVNENGRPPESESRAVKIHFFARTRGSPYKFYYRSYTYEHEVWSPWQDMTVDIPRYEIEKERNEKKTNGTDKKPSHTATGGCYLVPFTFNSRLMLAVPQFLKVQVPAPMPEGKTASQMGTNEDLAESAPQEYWEIKMGLSELRNGMWTPKFITSDAIAETPTPPLLEPVGQYQFIARDTHRRIRDMPSVVIDCFRVIPGVNENGEPIDPVMSPDDTIATPLAHVGMFSFTGSHFAAHKGDPPNTAGYEKWTDFHFQFATEGGEVVRVMKPLQSGRESDAFIHDEDVKVRYSTNDNDRESWIEYHGRPNEERMCYPFVGILLERLGNRDSLDSVFRYLAPANKAKEATWQDRQHLDQKFEADTYGASQAKPYMFKELVRPYALYNWEMGFHVPIAIADRLLQNQQFDLALKMMHYVFDPQSDDPGETVQQRVWKWHPFRKADSGQNIRAILAALRPNRPTRRMDGSTSGASDRLNPTWSPACDRRRT